MWIVLLRTLFTGLRIHMPGVCIVVVIGLAGSGGRRPDPEICAYFEGPRTYPYSFVFLYLFTLNLHYS